MKKAILSVVTICAAAVLLVGQDSTTAPADNSASKSASSKSSASKSAASKAASNPNAKYKIAMKYQPGMKYEITTQMEMESSFPSGPNGQRMKHKIQLTIKSYLDMPKPADDGTIAAKMVVSRIIATNKSGDSDEKTMDTDKPEEISGKGDAREMTAVIEPEYTVYFDKDGNIEKIDGIDELIAKMTEGRSPSHEYIDRHKKEMENVITSFVSAPVIYGKCQFNDIGESFDTVVFNPPYLFGGISGGSDAEGEDNLKLKLSSIEDSSDGKIAIVDVEGTIEANGKIAIRTGQIRFNLDKKILESIRLERSSEGDNDASQMKSEAIVKVVDKIPERAATSQPADSQPAK